MHTHPALQHFSDLLLPSPSGDEGRVADVLRTKLESLGFQPHTDQAGNLIVQLDGQAPSAPGFVFAAHMDEIGMVVTRIEPDGALHLTRSGGLHPWKLGEGAVDIYGDKATIQGVLSMGSTHTPDAADKSITWDSVRVITGLDPQTLKSMGVRPGIPVLPIQERRGPVIFGPPDDPLVGAWTFDDRMGCVALLRTLQTIQEAGIVPYHPTAIAFTTREEIGGLGAKYLARILDPAVFVSVDGSPMPPGSPLELDGRPGIWAKDRIAQYDPDLIRAFSAAALKAGTELQPVVFNGAASDASLVSYSLGVPKIICIGHVRENSHGYEVARLSVFDNLLNTLVAFLKTYRMDGE